MDDTFEYEYITYRVEWVFMIGTMGDSEGRTWAKELIEEKRFATKLEAEAYRDTHPDLELSRWGSWKTKNSYGQFAIVKREVRTDLTALQAERDAWKARAEAAEAALVMAKVGLVQARDDLDQYSRLVYPLDHPVHERCRHRDYKANPARLALDALTPPAALKGNNNDRL